MHVCSYYETIVTFRQFWICTIWAMWYLTVHYIVSGNIWKRLVKMGSRPHPFNWGNHTGFYNRCLPFSLIQINCRPTWSKMIVYLYIEVWTLCYMFMHKKVADISWQILHNCFFFVPIMSSSILLILFCPPHISIQKRQEIHQACPRGLPSSRLWGCFAM